MINQADLSNCDKEQIHLVAAIQPHGYFLAFRLADKAIYHASTNVANLTSVDSSDVHGKSLALVFGEETAKIISREAQLVEPKEPRLLRLRDLCGKAGLYEVYLYELEGLIAIEIEERLQTAEDDSLEFAQSHRRNRVFAEDLNSNDSLESIARHTCRTIRSMIGYDRVMMYRYLPTWDGEVIAEDKSAEAHSFLQHRFPATDIPLPARQLYSKNRSRLIANSAAVPVAIQPSVHYLTHKTIDLSNSKLRAVSPIHMEYLRNMNVGGSFSVAVIVAGELWGLIACHAAEATGIPHDVRMACESVAATFASLATIKEQVGQQTQTILFEERLRSLFSEWMSSPRLASSLMKSHTSIESLFDASGIALVTNDNVDIAGLTPPESLIKELASELKTKFISERKSILAIDHLAGLDSKFDRLKEISCGALATFSPNTDAAVFIVFRPEALRTITWGGDPRKTMEKRNYKGVINPRKSFESWNETVSGHSKPWSKFQIKGAEFLRDFIFNGLIPKERLISELGQRAGRQ